MKIDEQDKKLIEEAVRKSELKTSGEIVPVILKKSDSYPAAHFRLALITGIIFALICYYSYDFDDPIILLWIQIPGVILGFILAYIPRLKRLFTLQSEIEEEVYQRAIQAFYENKVSITKDRTGIMIFISMLEKKVEILADCGINEKVGKEYWNDLVNALIKQIREGHEIEGIINTIHSCGNSLNKFFPIQEDDINEITNKLITD